MAEKEGLHGDSASESPDNGALFLVPGGVRGSVITRDSLRRVQRAVEDYATKHMERAYSQQSVMRFRAIPVRKSR